MHLCALLRGLQSHVAFFASRFPFLDVSRQGPNVPATVLRHFLNFPPHSTSHAWLSVYGTQCNFNCISPLVHLNHGLWDNHHQDVESCD